MASVYSRRLWSVRNFAGTYDLFNPGPDIYVVRCVTAYNGGLAVCEFGLNDENNVGMLAANLDPIDGGFMIWPDIRLVWPAGATWQLSTNVGTDMTGHGYQLTPG